MVESSDISTAFESTSTSKTPSSELTEIKILLAFEAISERYLLPEIINWSPLISALVIGLSGSWFNGSKIAEV